MRALDRLASCFALVLAAACASTGSDSSSDGPDRVEREVTEALRGFEAAQEQRDATRAVAYLAPEFRMFLDGERVERDAIVRQIAETFASLERLETSFDDVEVLPLGPRAALSSFAFRDEIELAGGETVRQRGATTLLWRRDGSRWRIVYAHSDHRPEAQ